MTTLLAGGCAYNGYYTDYPYYGGSYPYYYGGPYRYYYGGPYAYYGSPYPYYGGSYPYYGGYYPYYGYCRRVFDPSGRPLW